MRTAAKENKAAHEKLIGETRLQFGRLNTELSAARNERDALKKEMQQATSQTTADQSAVSQQLGVAQSRIASLEASLSEARREADEAKRSLANHNTSAGASSEQVVSIINPV